MDSKILHHKGPLRSLTVSGSASRKGEAIVGHLPVTKENQPGARNSFPSAARAHQEGDGSKSEGSQPRALLTFKVFGAGDYKTKHSA